MFSLAFSPNPFRSYADHKFAATIVADAGVKGSFSSHRFYSQLFMTIYLVELSLKIIQWLTSKIVVLRMKVFSKL